MERACANCRFWMIPQAEGQAGECRRYPPTVFMMAIPPQPMGKLDIPGLHGKQAMTQAQLSFVSKWPPAPANAGCGEHQFDPESMPKNVASDTPA